MKMWQAAAQMTNKLFTQDFQSFFYAINSYNSFFWDASFVYAEVFEDIMSEEDFNTVYYDPKFGMNTHKALVIWVQATLNNTPEYQ